jgi:DNA end-binding protein Ku
MPAHAIGSATVSFGLVSIPVKLYSAAQPASAISFNLVHKTCGTRLKQQYVCPKESTIVERAEMGKGYEFAKGQYVLFNDEELKAIEEKATQTIEITEFVPKETIDPIWFDKAYYLGPEKGGDRAYRLLAKTMEKTGRWALAKYAARGKGYLVVVRPVQGGLAMQQLHYVDEIRPFSDVGLIDAEVKDAELALAIQLTDQVSTDAFKPEAYEDEVKRRVQEMIDRKVAGQEITEPEAPKQETQIIDLMEALKASLAKGGSPKAAGPRRVEPTAVEEPVSIAGRRGGAARPKKRAAK